MIRPYDIYDYYYIAYLDILGFKDLIQRKSCSFIWEIFNDYMIENPVVDIFYHGRSCFDMANIHMKVFSDSIIFYTQEDIENSFYALIASCLCFQESLLNRDEPILCRGAVVRGKMFVGQRDEDADIMFGQGIVDAYEMEEKKARYPRIIINQKTIDLATRAMNRDFIEGLYTMLRKESNGYYAVNYCKRLKEKNQCEKLYKLFENYYFSSAESSVKEKYSYLMDFIRPYCSQKDNE